MEAGKKLMTRLRQGVSVEEAPALLQEFEEERARERAPKTNPRRFKDSRTQRLSDLWFSQRKTATVAQKDQVGLTFISRVLGLGDEIALRFANGDREVYHQVGLKQSAIPLDTDVASFWQEMRRVFPGVYSDDDLSFLIRGGGVEAVLHFLWQLEIPLAEQSAILRALHENAHAYK